MPYSITEIALLAAPIAEKYGIKTLSLFGSYARGDYTAESDLDFHIIDCGQRMGLFELAGFQGDLEDRFKMPVDVLTAGDEEFLDQVKKEEIIVYQS